MQWVCQTILSLSAYESACEMYKNPMTQKPVFSEMAKFVVGTLTMFYYCLPCMRAFSSLQLRVTGELTCFYNALQVLKKFFL